MINKTNSKRDIACSLWVQSVSQCPIDPPAGQPPSADIGSQIADSSPVGYLIANRTLHCDFCLPCRLPAIDWPIGSLLATRKPTGYQFCNFMKITPISAIIF